MAHNEALTSPGWTVGCSVEVRLHDYKEGTPQQTPYFVEYWDVGGSISHKNTRNTFYSPTHGIILVHDMTNRKSHDNLQKWLVEILHKDGKDTAKNGNETIEIPDPEQFFGSTQVNNNHSLTFASGCLFIYRTFDIPDPHPCGGHQVWFTGRALSHEEAFE